MNTAMLKSVMALHGHTNRDVASLLGITEQSVSNKINENGTEFKQGEIAKMAKKYKLTPEQIKAIFFD
jgi:predicted transcriptional regulator